MGTIPGRVAQWMHIATAMAPLYQLDPLLVLAILDREGLGGDGLQPRGPTGLGDNGHGHGLAQIDDRYHPTVIPARGPDGKPLWMKPQFAILWVCEHLDFNVGLFDGSGADPLLCGVASYNASFRRVREAIRHLTHPINRDALVAVLDPLTTPSKPGTPGDYLSDVLARRESYVLSP